MEVLVRAERLRNAASASRGTEMDSTCRFVPFVRGAVVNGRPSLVMRCYYYSAAILSTGMRTKQETESKADQTRGPHSYYHREQIVRFIRRCLEQLMLALR